MNKNTTKPKLKPYGKAEDTQNPARIKISYICPICRVGGKLIHENRHKVKCTGCNATYDTPQIKQPQDPSESV